MERFAVIGLDTQEKKTEAEALLNELGYQSDKEWNNKYRQEPSCQVISRWENGNYCYYVCVEDNETPITLDQLRAKVKPTYPCMMEVWDDDGTNAVKADVVSEVEYKGVKAFLVYDEDTKDFYSYRHARPIQPDPIKEVIEKLKSNSETLTPNEAQLILDALEKNEK